MQSPIDFFSSLTDPRINRCKLHKSSNILFITIAPCLNGAEDWEEMQEYGEAKQDWLKTFLELRNGIPSHDTFNRPFAAFDLV